MIAVPVLRIVGTRCADPKQEAEFYKWYETTHVPEVLHRIPGVKSAALYKVADPREGDPRCIALYEMTDLKDIDNYHAKEERGEVSPFTPGPPMEVVWRANSLRLIKSY